MEQCIITIWDNIKKINKYIYIYIYIYICAVDEENITSAKFIERCMYDTGSVTILLWTLCRNERRRWCIDFSILQNFHLQCSHPITSNFTSDMPYCYYYYHYYYMIHLCAQKFISENQINWFAMVKFWLV